MTTLSPRLRELALSPSDQIFLAGTAGVRWSPPDPAAPIVTRNVSVPRGTVKRVALAFIAGEYGDQDMGQVAKLENLTYESFKQTVWKQRSGWQEKPKRRRRRKAA